MNNSAPENLHPVYFQNLDACRFLAAFAVLLFHFSNEIKGLFPQLAENSAFKLSYLFLSKGSLGVNFFFVLSGFLITYLILHERKRKGKFHLGKFLIRRTLRIWPLYFLIIGIGFLLFPLIFDDYHTNHRVEYYLLFLANFDEIYNGASDSINFLTSPWSVAVEEQFYLFWGIILFALFRVKKFKPEYLILLLYILSFVFRWYHASDERLIYYHTFSVCQDILTGSFIGVSLFNGRKWLNRAQEIPRAVVLIIYLIGIGLCVGKNKLFPGMLIVPERFILSLFFGFVIIDQIRGNHSFFKFGKIKLFNYLGKISYGIYMFHLVIMFVLIRYIPQDLSMGIYIPLFLLLSILLTFLVSALSYRFIESKFLSLKSKL